MSVAPEGAAATRVCYPRGVPGVVRSLVVFAVLAALLVLAGRADAAGKAGPAPARSKPDPDAAAQAALVAACKVEPDSALCREVRRLCAARLVRDVVVPTCRALDWYGDDVVREVTHLCPLWPDHPRCRAIRAACVTGQAAVLGARGEEACRVAAWAVGDPLGTASLPEGPGPAAPPDVPPGPPEADGGAAPDDDELTEDEVELVIDYCKSNAQDHRCTELRGACQLLDGNAAGPLVARTCRGLGYPMRGEPGAESPPDGAAPAADPAHGRAAIQSVTDRPRPPRPVAGQWIVGPVAGIADDARAFGDSGGLVGGALQTSTIGLTIPVAGTFDLLLAGTGEGGFAYRAALGVGVGGWVGDWLGLALTGGLGVEGVARGRVPFAAQVPARALAVANLSPRVATLAWVQAEWTFLSDDDDARVEGSPTFDFADGAQAGAMLILGGRRPANVPGPAGLGLGVILLEQHDARAVLFVLGLGFAQEAFNK